MSFDSLEKSQQDGQPILLFDFVRGSSSWYYTNFPEQLTALSHTYSPRAITRSTITMGGTVPKSTIEIRLPYDDAMVSPMNNGSLGKVTTVTVWRAHAGELTSYRAEWLGRVAKTSRDKLVTVLTCEPVFNSLQRIGLPQTYQRTCINPYGGKGCFVDPENHFYYYNVTAVNRNTVTVAAISISLIGGTIHKAATGESSTVIGQDGNVLTLWRPIASLAVGNTVKGYIGCDRSLGTCASVFGNAGNFKAWPGIPLINPFTIMRSVF